MNRLTDEEELELYRRMKAGDNEAANILAKSIIAWAHRLSFGFRNRGVDPEELESIAVCAINDALRRWEPSRARLIKASGYSIRGALMAATRDSTLIHCPQQIARKRNPQDKERFTPLEYTAGVCHIDKNPEQVDLSDLIDTLPERSQIVIRMRLQNYYYREIGERLGVSRTTVIEIERQAIDALRWEREEAPA